MPPIDDLPQIDDLGAVPDITREEDDNAKEQDIGPEEQDEAERLPDEEQISGEDQSGMLDETQEQKRWTKRAQQMLHTLNRELSKKNEVSFEKLSKGNSRKQAAYKFYTLLILNKEKAITVSEDGLYGKIVIGKGEKFNSMV